jgi:large subunit ribosomal protein L15
MVKLKKRKKASRMHGRGMGTHGWGSRKKHVGTSGHRGGIGMSGTGKKAGHKRTLVLKLYGSNYFGAKGITSKSTKKKVNDVMNVGEIERNLESLKKEFANKEGVLEMETYKILGDGEISSKVIIECKAASASAKEKIEAAGGKVIIEEVKEAKVYPPQPNNKSKQFVKPTEKKI